MLKESPEKTIQRMLNNRTADNLIYDTYDLFSDDEQDELVDTLVDYRADFKRWLKSEKELRDIFLEMIYASSTFQTHYFSDLLASYNDEN